MVETLIALIWLPALEAYAVTVATEADAVTCSCSTLARAARDATGRLGLLNQTQRSHLGPATRGFLKKHNTLTYILSKRGSNRKARNKSNYLTPRGEDTWESQ